MIAWYKTLLSQLKDKIIIIIFFLNNKIIIKKKKKLYL